MTNAVGQLEQSIAARGSSLPVSLELYDALIALQAQQELELLEVSTHLVLSNTPAQLAQLQDQLQAAQSSVASAVGQISLAPRPLAKIAHSLDEVTAHLDRAILDNNTQKQALLGKVATGEAIHTPALASITTALTELQRLKTRAARLSTELLRLQQTSNDAQDTQL